MTKTELVCIPLPGIGHLLSMVEFAKLIVQTDQHISILIVVYHVPIPQPLKLEAYVESQSREVDPNRITFITLPPISNPPPDPFSPTMIQLQRAQIKQALSDRGSKPTAFVIDMINFTLIDLANELCVPSYIYFTAGAALLDAVFHFQALADEKGTEDIAELVGDLNNELDIAGFRNRVPAKALPWVYLDEENARWFRAAIDMGRRFKEVKGILVNSFMELESYGLQALHDPDNMPPVYPVGPILALHESSQGGSRKDDYESIMRWLDEQPSRSVVFLCFGSMGCLDADQVKELANGLDRSGQRFLWSLRKPAQQGFFGFPSKDEIFEEALPEGFLDRTAHKGKIIAWAPQVAVLAHRAVGGFVSHCGWNSILESLWFGVPLATWPMYAEQQMNAFKLVKELELAVEISLYYRWDHKIGKGNFLVTADEVENGVKKLMSLDEEMRQKVQQMSDKCRQNLEDGGSSHNSLTHFINEVNGTIAL